MNNDRTRPFLEEPVYRCAPVSWATEYFRSKLKEYRRNNPLFDEYLNKIREEIEGRKLSYCGNILLFLKGETKTNWVSPSKSLLRTFVKLFNYDFSAKQTVDYIERCHLVYDRLLNDELKVSNEYRIFAKTCSWDGNTRDFVQLSLEPAKNPDNFDDFYWVDITFCSLQATLGDVDFFGDNKIEFISGKAIYEDALSLFDYYQGSKFLNKCLDFATSQLIKYRIVNKPVKIIFEFADALFYKINKHLTFKIKQEESEDN